jgi:hypothetical protein
MALQYDYRAVKNADDNAPRFAWILSAVDLGEVTKSNVDEIAFRLKFAETCGHNFLQGSLSMGSMKAYIRSMIGYKTNVGNRTRFQFMKKIMRATEDKVERLGGHDA